MRLIFFILFSLILFLFVGCTKDRVCFCTGINGFEDNEIIFPNATKRDAIDACKDQESIWPEKYFTCELQ